MADVSPDDPTTTPADPSETPESPLPPQPQAEPELEAQPEPEPELEAPPEPEPEPAPEPVPAVPVATEPSPELEATTLVPALGTSSGTSNDGDGEAGGEWELLVSKLQTWLASGKLQTLWAQARTPLTLTLAAAGLLLVLRLYTGLLGILEGLPLVPGLLELVGVIWTLRYGLPKLLQRSQREALIQGLQERWRRFSGRD
jgi:hypothetical protein